MSLKYANIAKFIMKCSLCTLIHIVAMQIHTLYFGLEQPISEIK
jgi:hypothetical protein